MFRMPRFARHAGVVVLLVAAVSGRAAAQRGTLTARMTGKRTTPASDTVALRIAVQMTPGWHIGAAQPGNVGVPTQLTWRLPSGWRLLATRWPTPRTAVVGRDTVFEYHGPFTIEATILARGPRRSGRVQSVMSYGICRNVCIPGRLTLTYDVP